jgi:hypothetical protein
MMQALRDYVCVVEQLSKYCMQQQQIPTAGAAPAALKLALTSNRRDYWPCLLSIQLKNNFIQIQSTSIRCCCDSKQPALATE